MCGYTAIVKLIRDVYRNYDEKTDEEYNRYFRICDSFHCS